MVVGENEMIDTNGWYYYEENLHGSIIKVTMNTFGVVQFVNRENIYGSKFEECDLDFLINAVIDTLNRDITPATRRYLETIIKQIERDMPNEW